MSDEIRERSSSLDFARPRLASAPEPPDLAALAERMEAAAERMEQAAAALEEKATSIEQTAAPLLERLSQESVKGTGGATR